VNGRRTTWLRWAGRLGAAGLGVALAVGLGALVPERLPEPSLPNRVFARPHRIVPGQEVAATHLLERIERLGYRRTRTSRPNLGEFFRGDQRIVIHRREFDGPQGPVAALRYDLRLGWDGRVAGIRDETGADLGEAVLDPETLGALADDAPTDRVLVRLGELPRHLIDALLVVEDRRFYEHHGVDLHRLAGAMVANLRARRVRQGGSTITQQLVKNVFLSHERTVLRKLREAWLALRVERAHGKDEILEAYLNTIYLGQRGPVSVVGVEAAARHYFGHSARTLGLAESALLVGMIRGPGYYSPWKHPEKALERRNRVLALMAKAKVVSEQEAAAARGQPLGNVARPAAPPRSAWFLARLEREIGTALPDLDLHRDRIVVFSGLDAQLQLEAERAVGRGLEELEGAFPRLRGGDAKLQAALVALDPRSGAILAYVGGRSWADSQFDRVAQARRQPGSAFKPVVLLAALARGEAGAPPFTLASLLLDEPLEVDTPQGAWRPANYEKEFHGAVTLRRAVEDSLNVPIVRVAQAVGPEAIVAVARRMGIESALAPVPSLALGTSEISPLELARAYALLANGGERVEVRSAFHVTDARLRPLLESPPLREREFDPAEVRLVTSALEGVVDRGTGHSLRALGYRGPAAGKTGTTNDARDAWFVGYTPELVAAVWVGFDDGRPLGLTGARAALPIFARFLIGALGPEGGSDFAEPPGLESVSIHAGSGLRAGFLCWGEPEWFLAGSAPRERCGPDWLARKEPAEAPGVPGDAAPRPAPHPIDRLFGALFEIVEEATRAH
jgi:penicillin-binding protein 1B